MQHGLRAALGQYSKWNAQIQPELLWYSINGGYTNFNRKSYEIKHDLAFENYFCDGITVE